MLTSDNLQKAGVTTIAEAIRSVSADSAGSIGNGLHQTGFSAGGSAVSLRGLGVSSTLVLVDGLRSTNFPINDDGHNAYVDLNSIPFSQWSNGLKCSRTALRRPTALTRSAASST